MANPSSIASLQVCRTKLGAVVKLGDNLYRLEADRYKSLAAFEELILKNPTNLFETLAKADEETSDPLPLIPFSPLKTPVLGAGVTFASSHRERRLEAQRAGRVLELSDDGRPTPYDVVYDTENPPEVFMKAFVPGHLAKPTDLWIRPDGAPGGGFGSSVPEPERILVISAEGQIVAETLGSDTTARQMESMSPLYLPAAKTYPGCATINPWLTVFNPSTPREPVIIRMTIHRNGDCVYDDQYASTEMKRVATGLVVRARTMAGDGSGTYKHGLMLFTGTGIVPPIEFSLAKGDLVTIASPQLGSVQAKVKIVNYNFGPA